MAVDVIIPIRDITDLKEDSTGDLAAVVSILDIIIIVAEAMETFQDQLHQYKTIMPFSVYHGQQHLMK